MILVGTRDFGGEAWLARLREAGGRSSEVAGWYARRLDLVELGQTFTAPPRPREFARLVGRTDARLFWTVKAHRGLTHERDETMSAARRFREGVAPLVDTGRLVAVLAQFPPHFLAHPTNRAYLCRLRAALDAPLVVELRHPSWASARTVDFLRGWGIVVAAVDGPSVARLPRFWTATTGDLAYVRLHGRNEAAWWRRGAGGRHEYAYTRRELLAWVPRLRELERRTERVAVVFNTCGEEALGAAIALRRWLGPREAAKGAPGAQGRGAAPEGVFSDPSPEVLAPGGPRGLSSAHDAPAARDG